MRNLALDILLASLAHASVEDLAINHSGKSQDFDNQTNKLVDQSVSQVSTGRWINNLFDNVPDGMVNRALKAPPHHHLDQVLDDTTVAKGSSQALSGKVIGDGKYLLFESPQRTSSGKSAFYFGFRANDQGQPVGDKLAIKISDKKETMARESTNYNKIASGLFPGRFVKKIDYFPNRLNEEIASDFDRQCALVLELGEADLKAVVAERGGLDERLLRNAAKAAAECMQAMHTSGYVWTDLKTQNFVTVGDGAKGIDIESAMPHRSEPIDYTPEVCPPEFARFADTMDLSARKGEFFQLDYSYDIWSYGMYLYELATGRGYFGGMTNPKIMETLASEDFEVDVSDVSDDNLRNLIEQCLSIDPKKRPNILQILVHPYLIGFQSRYGFPR